MDECRSTTDQLLTSEPLRRPDEGRSTLHTSTFPATKTCVVWLADVPGANRYQWARKHDRVRRSAAADSSQRRVRPALAERRAVAGAARSARRETWEAGRLELSGTRRCSARAGATVAKGGAEKHPLAGRPDRRAWSPPGEDDRAEQPTWKGGATVFKKHGTMPERSACASARWAQRVLAPGMDGYIMEHRRQMVRPCRVPA